MSKRNPLIIDRHAPGRGGSAYSRRKPRGVFFIFLAWVAVALQLPSLPAAVAAEPLVVALSQSPLVLPFHVAESEGYFRAEGLAVRLDEVIGGHRSMQQVLDGKADVATSSEAVVMFTSFGRSDFAVLASFVTTTDDVKVISRGDRGVSRPEDLAHKRVGTVVGAASHYYLDTLLIIHGIDPRTVEIVGLQPEAMASALKRGEVDAVAVWQPFAFRVARDVPQSEMLPDGGFYTLSFNLVVPRRLIGARDDDLAKLLRALDRAEAFIAAHPQQAKAILQSRLQLDQAYIDWMWPRYHYRLALDQSLLSTLESEARWARQEGYVKAAHSPNYLSLIHSAPLRRLRPAAVGIVE